MYTPPAFREDDLQTIHALMRDNSFAILVTQQDGVPLATHLPFMLDTERGPYGTLIAHMARANTQWRAFADQQEALAIFQGPHAYVTPSWYDPGLNVPTWNYGAVHAYGVPRLINDEATLYAMLSRLTATHEAGFEQPWLFEIGADDFRGKLKGIVGFEMEITRLEGKMKLSQNRSPVEQERVAAALAESPNATVASVGQLMKQRQEKRQ
jgi:transcriptional regulator